MGTTPIEFPSLAKPHHWFYNSFFPLYLYSRSVSTFQIVLWLTLYHQVLSEELRDSHCYRLSGSLVKALKLSLNVLKTTKLWCIQHL